MKIEKVIISYDDQPEEVRDSILGILADFKANYKEYCEEVITIEYEVPEVIKKSYTIRDILTIHTLINEYHNDNKEVMEAWKSITQSLS